MEKVDQQSSTNRSSEDENNDHEGQIGTTLKEYLSKLSDDSFKLHYKPMGEIVLTEEQYDLVREVYDENFDESDSTLVYQLFQNFLHIRSS
mmetsp:Transcript_18814/g.21015  ORF Transcript_18814/g.21015 Transcript_18814/m.21015 type:complete len:91 (+) Transcript_18814:29-301(+)